MSSIEQRFVEGSMLEGKHKPQTRLAAESMRDHNAYITC